MSWTPEGERSNRKLQKSQKSLNRNCSRMTKTPKFSDWGSLYRSLRPSLSIWTSSEMRLSFERAGNRTKRQKHKASYPSNNLPTKSWTLAQNRMRCPCRYKNSRSANKSTNNVQAAATKSSMKKWVSLLLSGRIPRKRINYPTFSWTKSTADIRAEDQVQ